LIIFYLCNYWVVSKDKIEKSKNLHQNLPIPFIYTVVIMIYNIMNLKEIFYLNLWSTKFFTNRVRFWIWSQTNKFDLSKLILMKRLRYQSLTNCNEIMGDNHILKQCIFQQKKFHIHSLYNQNLPYTKSFFDLAILWYKKEETNIIEMGERFCIR
jgi:hypothetical protein